MVGSCAPGLLKFAPGCLWCFAWGLEFVGVPSGLLGESSFVVLWSWSDLLPEFTSLEREGDLHRWLNCVLCVQRGKGNGGLTG